MGDIVALEDDSDPGQKLVIGAAAGEGITPYDITFPYIGMWW